MNKKGLYSGGIALATIVLVIVISFNITSAVQAGESQGKADAILDAKWEIQNMRHLLEATAVDAMVKEIAKTCSYDKQNLEIIGNAVKTAVGDAPTKLAQTNCRIGTVNYYSNPTGSNIEIRIEMKCEQNISPDLKVIYEKKIEIKKEVDVSGGGGIVPCNIEIRNKVGSDRLFGYEFP